MPFWKGVVLRNVEVRLEDVPSGTVTLDEVSVTSGSPRVVHVRGGKIAVTGDLADIEREVGALRERLRKSAGSTSGAASATEVDVQGLEVVLHTPSDGIDATLSGLAIGREDGGYVLAATAVRAAWKGAVVHATGVRLDLLKAGEGSEPGLSVRKLSTEGLDADMTALTSEDAPPPPPQHDSSQAPSSTVPAVHGVDRLVAWRENVRSRRSSTRSSRLAHRSSSAAWWLTSTAGRERSTLAPAR